MEDFEMYNRIAFKRDNFIKYTGRNILIKGVKGNQLFLKLIHSLLIKSELTLEIGTGTGVIPFWMKPLKRKMICIDFSPNMIKIAKKNCRNSPNIKFLVADLNNLPFENEQFTLVIKRLAPDNLAEIYRVLKPKKDFINFTNGEKDGREIKEMFRLPCHKSIVEYKKELINHNFLIENEKEFLFKEIYNNPDDLITMSEIGILKQDFLKKKDYYKDKLRLYFEKNKKFILTRHKYLTHAIKTV